MHRTLLCLLLLLGVSVPFAWYSQSLEKRNHALLAAIKNDDASAAMAALKAGADPNAGETLSLTSSRRSSRSLSGRLNRRHRQARKGLSALLLAVGITKPCIIDDYPCPPPNTGLIAALLEAGADPNSKDNDGQTALMVAAGHTMAEPTNPTIIQMLLQRGADINARDKNHKTVLGYIKTDVRLIREQVSEAKKLHPSIDLSSTVTWHTLKSIERMTAYLMQAGAKE